MLPLKHLLLVVILAFQCVSYGNTKAPDSYQSDTAHVNQCLELSSNLLFIYPDSAQKYIDTILILSKKVNYEYGLNKGHNLQGIIYWITNNLDDALKQYKLALAYTNNLDSERDKAVILSNIALLFSHIYEIDSAKLYFNKTILFAEENNILDIQNKAVFDLGNLNLNQGNYIDAAHNLTKVKEQLEINHDSVLLMYVHSAFGILYTRLNKFEPALLNYKKAIELDQVIPGVDNISNNYINIGELYFSLQSNFDTALYFYQKAIETALPHFKNNIELSANINSGNTFLEMNELDSVNSYYQKAISDTLINSFPDRKAALLINIGVYHIKNKDYIEARHYLNTGLDMVNKLGILHYKVVALHKLSLLDSIEGNFKQSRQYYVDFKTVSDSLKKINAENEIAILEFEKFMEQEKLNNQDLVEENEIKSKMMWLSIATVLALLILLFMLYLNRTRVKHLHKLLSGKHEDLKILNEELTVTNETLVTQQEQLKELNISKDKFFSILSHDLKSPFNGLLGMLGLINDEWEQISDEEKRNMLQLLFSSSKKTYNLLEDILSWAKTQQGLIKSKPEIININTKIKETTDLLMAQIVAKDQQLTLDVPAKLEINSDELLFSHIIQNLVNNAIKFTPQNGSITVKSDTIDNQIHVCVIDDGIGIPKDKISKIFDMNSDFNRPGTAGEKSTGMGLLLTKEYAKIINAKLTVKSIEGKGSTFCLIVPIA
ncbi:MAG: ATP-binding protein [Bacteroidota bacterium]